MAIFAAEQTAATIPDSTETLATPSLMSVDEIPEIQAARESARREAEAILERNRRNIVEGQYERPLMPVDPLGTARRAVEEKRLYGEDSLRYRRTRRGLVFDGERLFAEAKRKNTWEYFPAKLQERDMQSGHYMAYGHSILETVTGGLSPLAEAEEQEVRIGEYVEEYTYEALGSMLGRLASEQTVHVNTVSECPDWAIDAYRNESKISYGGYVPAISKIILRGMQINGGLDRYQQQLALPGTYITHDVVVAALEEMGALEPDQAIDKTQLRGTQLIDHHADGILGIAEVLDRKASEFSDKNIYLGEVVPEGFHKDYNVVSINNQARHRAEQLRDKYEELADYLIELVENDTDQWAAESLVDNFVKRVLLDIARADPDRAEEMFDKATADGFRRVAVLRKLGRHDEAKKLQSRVEELAPPPAYCGAGSCGLEAVHPASAEATRAHRLGLSGNLIHDTERACPSCSKMTVYYDESGNKACTGCGLSQVNGFVSRASDNEEKEH